MSAGAGGARGAERIRLCGSGSAADRHVLLQRDGRHRSMVVPAVPARDLQMQRRVSRLLLPGASAHVIRSRHRI